MFDTEIANQYLSAGINYLGVNVDPDNTTISYLVQGIVYFADYSEGVDFHLPYLDGIDDYLPTFDYITPPLCTMPYDFGASEYIDEEMVQFYAAHRNRSYEEDYPDHPYIDSGYSNFLVNLDHFVDPDLPLAFTWMGHFSSCDNVLILNDLEDLNTTDSRSFPPKTFESFLNFYPQASVISSGDIPVVYPTFEDRCHYLYQL